MANEKQIIDLNRNADIRRSFVQWTHTLTGAFLDFYSSARRISLTRKHKFPWVANWYNLDSLYHGLQTRITFKKTYADWLVDQTTLYCGPQLERIYFFRSNGNVTSKIWNRNFSRKARKATNIEMLEYLRSSRNEAVNPLSKQTHLTFKDNDRAGEDPKAMLWQELTISASVETRDTSIWESELHMDSLRTKWPRTGLSEVKVRLAKGWM